MLPGVQRALGKSWLATSPHPSHTHTYTRLLHPSYNPSFLFKIWVKPLLPLSPRLARSFAISYLAFSPLSSVVVCEPASIKEAVGFYKPLAVLVLGLCPCPSLNRDLSNLSEAVWSAFDWIYWFAATHRLTWLWQDGCFHNKTNHQQDYNSISLCFNWTSRWFLPLWLLLQLIPKMTLDVG